MSDNIIFLVLWVGLIQIAVTGLIGMVVSQSLDRIEKHLGCQESGGGKQGAGE